MHEQTTSIPPRALPERGQDQDLAQAELATRLAFFIAGFGLACWAPMVPYAKARIGASHTELGSVLLCLGLGSVLGMPAAGALASRLGSKAAIVGGSFGLLLVLPILATASGTIALGAALFLFGLSLGAIDVAANVHGNAVQHRAGRPLMSGFHGVYSVGGLLGAAAMTGALSLGVDIAACAMAASAIVLACVVFAAPRFMATRTHGTASVFMLAHGVVALLGLMALLVFLVEGAMLDWSALLLAESRLVAMDHAGAGYAVFALAMTAARLPGDRFVAVAGSRITLAAGAVLTGIGVALAAWPPSLAWALCGFGLAGIGAANIVPVVFSLAGTQQAMPAGYAIAAVSTLGYLGVFAGPAAIGHAAGLVGLAAAFGMLAALMAIVAMLAGAAVHRSAPMATSATRDPASI